jgi:hypothetical protein
LAIPVIFPPGWAKLLMKPERTGSVAGAITMGMVEVARWAAAIAEVATATITSGLRAISSLISEDKRSAFPSAPQVVTHNTACSSSSRCFSTIGTKKLFELPAVGAFSLS